MTTTNTQGSKNGQVRKTLASQLDRLDGILDALSDGLNEAVAFTVQEAVSMAVKEAVQVAITEVLTNPLLLQKLTAATNMPAATTVSEQGESMWCRFKGAMKSAWKATCSVAGKVWAGTVSAMEKVGGCAGSLAVTIASKATTTVKVSWLWALFLGHLARRFRTPLVISLLIGAMVGVGCYWAGPVVASTMSGVAGSLIASAVQAFRRMFLSGDLSMS